jgi:benzoyl-CoA reductase/2-hydroxyglutaryl-CoA dehydratase subunit BcrC/BadD/HgdB
MEATEGLCPFARALANDLARRGRAVAAVFTTVCDQMRRAAEVFAARCPNRPTFVLNVPATWQSPAAMDMYVDELRRLGGFLVGLGGHAPTDERLTEVMLAYDGARRRILAARGRLTARRFAELLADFGRRGVLLHRQLWCDLWHGQLPRIRRQTALPVLDIDVADEDADFGRQAGKIQAFMEMLRGK